MTVKEVYQSLGQFEFELLGNVPREVLDSINYFGHIAIIPGRIDPRQYGDGCLDAARYVGVVRKKKIADDGRTNLIEDDIRISGVSMNFWLGDEDNKGYIFETAINYTNESFTNIMSPVASGGLVPPACTIGSVHTITGTYSGRHQYETPRTAIQYVCDTLSDNNGVPGTGNGKVTWRVNNDGSFDAGKETDLYVTNPTCIFMRKGGTQGEDMFTRALPSTTDLDVDVEDFSTRVVMLAESDGANLATGSADIANIAPGVNVYKDINGNTLNMTRMVSETETLEQWADVRAELALRQVITTRKTLTMTTDDFDIVGSFNVGDYVWVYDPDAGLYDLNNEVYVRGVRINPTKLQVTEADWPVLMGYTVAYRAADGTWTDLTDYIHWEEDQPSEVVVGDFARTLEGIDTPDIGARLDSLGADTTIPDNPTFTGTPFTTSSYEDNTGNLKSQMTLTWTTPTNTDTSAITDGNIYEISFKRTGIGSDWETRMVGWGTNTLLLTNLLPSASYDFRVRAVDTNGHQSAWSSTYAQATNSTPSIPGAVTISSVGTDAAEDTLGVMKAIAFVSWTQPNNTDASTIIDGASYEIQYKNNSAPSSGWASQTTAFTSTSITIPNLNPGTLYNFKVRAIDTSGHIGAFGSISNQTMASSASIPAAPSLPSVSSDSSEDPQGVLKAFALVSWSQPLNTDGSTIIDGQLYEIQYKHTSASNWSSQNVAFGTTSTYVSNLNPGASADFKVRAVDNSGHVGAFSSTKTVVLSSVPSVPDVPSMTPSGFATSSYEVGNQTRARILATWSTPNNTDTSAIIDGGYYELQFKIDGQSDWETRTVAWGTNSLLLQDLVANTTYRFRIRAIDTTGHISAYSAEGTRLTGNSPTIPNAPTWTTGSFTQSVYLDTNGVAKASETVVWSTPTNTDSSAVTDGDHYEINLRKTGDTDWTVYNIPMGTNTHRFFDLPVGTGFDARIRLWDKGGNVSSFSSTTTFTTAEDTIAPSTPAAPTVATSLVGVQITHSLGKASGGTFNLEADLAYLEVHKGATSGFTISSSTLIGTILANAGNLQTAVPMVQTFPIGDTTQQWYKVRAVDMSGNISNGSTSASSTASLIDDAHISDLTVSKVSAGTISANWLLGSSIRTAASPNARVELNTTGFQAYDSGNNNTVAITNAGLFSLKSPPSVAATPVIQFVGKGPVWNDTTGTSAINITRPSGITVGDFMLAFVQTNATASATGAFTGWTQVGTTVRADATTDTNLMIFKRDYVLDDPAEWTGSTTTTGLSRVQSVVLAYRGCDVAANQFIATSTNNSAVAASSIGTGTATNNNAGAWSVAAFAAFDDNTGGNWTSTEAAERTDTEVGGATPWGNLAVYDSNGTVATTGQSRTGTFTPGASTNWLSAVAWIGLLKPLPTSQSRLELDHTGLRAYDQVNNKTLDIAAATGSIDLQGNVSSFNYIEGAQGWRIAGNGATQFEDINVLRSLGADTGSFIDLSVQDVPVATQDWYDIKTPAVKVARENLLNVSNDGSGTLINWDTEYYQRNVTNPTSDMHSTVTNQSRLIAPTTGIYHIAAMIGTRWTTGAPTNSVDILNVRKNSGGSSGGGILVAQAVSNRTGGNFATCIVSSDIALNAGDYIEFFTFGNNVGGSSVRTINTDVGQTQAHLRFVSSLNGTGTGGTNITIVEFPATAVRAFQGNNTERPPNIGDWVYQGQFDSNYGNQKSIVMFDYTSIQNTLSGKSIGACKVRFHVTHSYYSTMDVSIGTTNNTNELTWPGAGGVTPNLVTRALCAAGSTYTVSLGTTIGDQFKNNTSKGLVFGPGPTTSLGYYGYMVGLQFGAQDPTLIFTYS